MKYHISTSIIINADITTVWETFTHFESYPQWNSFIKSINGDVRKGAKINVEIDGMKFKPEVISFEKEKELIWLGNFILPRIFDGKHAFKFQRNTNGTTTLIHEEHFRGLLLPLMKKKLRTEVIDGFKQFNEILKKKSEARA